MKNNLITEKKKEKRKLSLEEKKRKKEKREVNKEDKKELEILN